MNLFWWLNSALDNIALSWRGFQLILSLVGILITFLIHSSVGHAADSERTRVIDFEDALVEGVNKRPLDSLNTISEKDRKRKKIHLYRKRTGFRSETAEVLREMRMSQ